MYKCNLKTFPVIGLIPQQFRRSLFLEPDAINAKSKCYQTNEFISFNKLNSYYHAYEVFLHQLHIYPMENLVARTGQSYLGDFHRSVLLVSPDRLLW